jgi:hypothetical protein
MSAAPSVPTDLTQTHIVDSILRDPIPEKESSDDRAWDWLIAFGLVSPFSLIGRLDLNRLLKEYDSRRDGALSRQSLRTIRVDFPRMQVFWNDLGNALSLDFPWNCDAAEKLMTSILSVAGIEYLQGMDRYFFIALAISAKFTRCRRVAYALTYHLTAELIKLSDMRRFLGGGSTMVQWFSELERELKIYNPALIAQLRERNQSVFMFGLRWVLTWFADDYRIEGLLPLWDNIIERKDEHDAYMKALCIAHAAQVTDAGAVLAGAHREWNVPAALAIAHKIWWRPTQISECCLLIVFIVFCVYRYLGG